MEIEYSLAKNNLKTFQINSFFYHSSYAPDKEADRFVQSVNFPYTPSVLFIVEPGLNYCLDLIKEKFPETQIVCIRIIPDFFDSDSSINFNHLEKELFSRFTSEQILDSFLIVWPAAEKIFNEQVKQIWETYKAQLETRKTELISRQYFEKKWFLNSINFFKYCKTKVILNPTDKPVLIAASGPSLKDGLKTIFQYQNNFIIIALSSAINTLLKHGIKPDFCVSTDGGFWATKHLIPLAQNTIPLAVASESAVQKQFLQTHPIIPLSYSDGLSSLLFKELNFPYILAERNPTVSGTALILARQLTSGKVFFAGLDLSCQKGFSHTQPNVIETENSIKDNRIKNVYTRSINGEFNTDSLEIFRTNFSLMENVDNCFRIINKNIVNKLGKIKDINWEDFNITAKGYSKIEKSTLFQLPSPISEKDSEIINNKLKNFILQNQNTDNWKNNLFPIDFLSIKHSSTDSKDKLIEQLEHKNKAYIKRLWRILNDD